MRKKIILSDHQYKFYLKDELEKFGLGLDLKTGHLSYLPGGGILDSLTPALFVVLRHGKTYANAHDIMQGHSNLTNALGTGPNDLNPEGVASSIELTDKLFKLGDFDIMLSTLLARGINTVRPYCKRAHVPLRILPRLSEFNWGILENKAMKDIIGYTEYNSIVQGFLNNNALTRPPGGEM
ncbi:MAG: histidine phosphatase family protein, partial [Candidatus Margulisiibacteriota bacterium]